MKNSFLLVLGLIAVTALSLAFILPKTEMSPYPYQIGDVIEDFSLKNVDNKMVSLADYEDAKGFIIIFTCNECPYSVMYEDRIIALDKINKRKGFPVIAINPNDPEAMPGDGFEEMIVRAEEKGFPFPYLFDEGQKVYPKFGAERTPHVFLVSKTDKGNVLEYVGAIDDNARNADKVKVNYVSDAVDALLNGEELELTNTKAIGCSIKTM